MKTPRFAESATRLLRNRRGKFALNDLDPELKFRLLVVSDDHVPTTSAELIDPRAGPVSLKLKSHDLDTRDPARVLRGRVVDDTGQPVSGAIIEPFAVKTARSTRFGGLRGIDAMAVSDEKGRFRLGVNEKNSSIMVKVKAPYLAPLKTSALTSGEAIHTIELDAGVTITGKVLKNGKPFGGIALGLAQQNRSAGSFLGDFKIATNADGDFHFLNIPANESYHIYGLMDQCRVHGAIAVRGVRTAGNDTTQDVGSLEMKPAHRLSGKVIASDGKQIPAGSRVLISRDKAWDFQTTTIAKDGTFSFEGLPDEQYSLSARIEGYHISPKNRSFDILNQFSLEGVIKKDIENFRLLMDAGPRPNSGFDSRRFSREDFEEHRRRQKSPLQGIPPETEATRRDE